MGLTTTIESSEAGDAAPGDGAGAGSCAARDMEGIRSDGDAPGATRARGGSARPSQAGGAAGPAAGSAASGDGAAGAGSAPRALPVADAPPPRGSAASRDAPPGSPITTAQSAA